jgi:8-oxo-dGTP pyrophosphatase MutT (NUDIX family)
VIRHFTASGIVLSGDGHVLLVQHRDLGCWLYPGGHIDANEDPVQAVLREVREETGLTCQIIAESRFSYPAARVVASPFTICVQDIRGDLRLGPHQHIDMVYVLRPTSGQLTPQTSEVADCAWVPLRQVATLDTPSELSAMIESAARYARELHTGTPAARLLPARHGGNRCLK